MPEPRREKLPFDTTYRGFVTNRPLDSSLPSPPEDRCDQQLQELGLQPRYQFGVLETMGLNLKELQGRVLDVGLGGGRAFEQALLAGVDIYGVEIARLARSGPAFRSGSASIRESVNLENLSRIIGLYPDRIKEADAAREIPFSDNSFDTVIACMSLPAYARSPLEAANSILEMIRVSRGRVVFTVGTTSCPEASDSFNYGTGVNKFGFKTTQFLEDLQQHGLSLEWAQVPDPSSQDGEVILSAHLDVSGKNPGLLQEFKVWVQQNPDYYRL